MTARWSDPGRLSVPPTGYVRAVNHADVLDLRSAGRIGRPGTWLRGAPRDDEERIEQVERRAQKLVAGSLILLAAYIAWDSITSLLANERPEPSLVGILLAIAPLSVMWWLARQKRRVGTALGSRAMTADAFQPDACFWLSLFLLIGIGANALLAWWWADPLAALGMTVFIGREALEAWRGDDD